MAQTIAQHTVATFTSPVNGTTPIDANTVRGNDNTLRSSYNDHDSDPGIHLQSSALASRPAAGTTGRKWLSTDSGSYRLFFDDGSVWQELSYLSTAGGTVSGNLTVTGTLTGDITGNAATATRLLTARTINGTAFDGTANITITAVNPNALTIGSYLTGGSYTGGSAVTIAVDATNLNTASKVVARDASGNFAAGTITAALAGNATTATTLATARTINGVSFDGSANITVAADAGTLTGSTLASGVTASSLTSVGTLTSGAIGAGFTAIPNSALANSSVTVNGTSIALGASGTVTAAAGTLTGSTLASGVTASSLTSLGTLSSLAVSGNTNLGAEVFRSSGASYMRLDGGSGSGTGANLVLFGETHATAPGRVALTATSATGEIHFSVNGALRWRMDSNGHFLAGSDATYDIGASGANRPRSIYTSTSVISPRLSTATAGFFGSAFTATGYQMYADATYGAVIAGYGTTSDVSFLGRNGNVVLAITDSTGVKLGFYGTAPQAKPTITGSRGANAALASLLTALAALGLLVDSTT